MSTFRNEELKCPLCGETFSAAVVMSFSIVGESRSLDGDPYEPLLFETVHLCPHCGYVFLDANSEPDANTRRLVRSENYQKILQAEDCDETARKLLLLAYLAEQKGDAATASVQYLHAYWVFRDKDLPGKEEALDKAVEAMEHYLEGHADRNAALVLVDLYRQKGSFEEALETLNSLGKYLRGNDNLLKTAAFEWRLIMAEDSKVHLVGEV